MKKEKNQKIFLENLDKGQGIVSYACENTGISRQTYYRWIKEDKDFAKACEDVKESVIDRVESKLMNVMNDADAPGHLTAIIFWLKTQAKHRGYVERSEISADLHTDEKKTKEQLLEELEKLRSLTDE